MTDRARVVADYLAGQTSRQVAATHGVDPQTVMRWVRQAGHEPRKRGQKPTAPVEQILTLRRKNKLPWGQIAAATSMSRTGARRAYEAATGDIGSIDHRRHLTARQADRLRELYQRIPPLSYGLATRTSEEGRRLRDQLAAHRAAGVSMRELGAALGVTAGAVAYITSD